MKPLLACTPLEMHYAGRCVLRAPAFALAAGEVMIVRGASGSGKSTLLALIAGLIDPNVGEVRLRGEAWTSVARLQRDRRRAELIGFMPQRQHLLGALSAFDNVLLARFLRDGRIDSAARQTAHERLAALGVAARAQAFISTLSGGEAQRVALARALMNDPPLVLVDEPTANLDDATATAALDALRAAVDSEQSALIIATHDPRVLAHWPGVSTLELQSC